jgi:hypothetical protein
MINQTNSAILNRQFVLSTLKQHLDQIYSFGVHSIALFGSVSSNQASKNSDLDFLVEFEEEITFDRYMDLKFFLEDLFNQKIDLVIKEDLKPQIRETIINQAIDVA